MAQFLGISVDELVHKHYGHKSEGGRHLLLEDHKRKPCPFLVLDGAKHRCRIYQVRPQGCHAFPFETDFGRNGVECPGAREVYASLGIERN